MAVSLTPAQANALRFIETRIAEQGTAPSFDEIRRHLGLASKSGVHRIVLALEARGRIRRLHGAARAMEVLPAAPAACPRCHHPLTGT